MAKQIINIGNQSNDGTGDSIRDSFKKVNDNFTELYGAAGLSGGLYFTKLEDAPKRLTASTTGTIALLSSDFFGSTITNKVLVPGTGIAIDNSITGTITISNSFSSLATDTNPQLGGNLNGNSFRGINFSDPIDAQDLVTKNYADNNSPTSRVNLYVSTNGRDTFPPDVPISKQGRSLAYAFRTINYACQVAESIISTSTLELSSYQQPVTFDNGNSTATVYSSTASTVIAGSTRVYLDIGIYAGTDQWIKGDIKPGQFIVGQYSNTIGFINDLGQEDILGTIYEFYEVDIKGGNGFTPGESLEFAYQVPTSHITIFVESGIYYEQYPIRVAANVSIRGDEFRRCIIKPASGTSTSKWAKVWFRRDDTFDGLTRADNHGRTGLAPIGQPFGYHYLTDPTDINSAPRLNEDMDVFLMNDASILRAISCHEHGGFMGVLDPLGQILTKSPYIQNCSSLGRTLNEKVFTGGLYVDGFSGNLECNPADAVTYWTGTTSIAVSGLIYRNPQTPTSFYHLGNRYEVDYYDPTFVYNETKCSRDVGLIVDSLATDLLFTDNGATQCNFAGLQYWAQNGYTGVIGAELTTTTNTIEYVKSLAQQIVISSTTGTRYTSLTQYVSSSVGSAAEFSKVGTEFTTIKNAIANGNVDGITDFIVSPGQSVVSSNAQYAYNLLQNNKEYIKAEAIAYITATNASFVYDHDKCSRDIGYMVDCVSFDVLYGGNRQAVQAGVYYYNYSTTSSVITGEIVQTTAAYTRLRNILPSIVTNVAIVPSPSNSQIQVTSLPAASATEGTSLQSMVDLIINIITSGPAAADPEVPISLSMTSDTNARRAAAILAANRDFIKAEIVAYVNSTAGGSGDIHLNPRNAGGIGYPNGIIPINSGTGYSFAPLVLFSQPTEGGGFPAQGYAQISAGGTLTNVVITNPGSGYVTGVTVSFIGGNPVTPAADIAIPNDHIKIGYIGVLPATIELGTAGNKSMLSADFTQVNDLGYGYVGVNNGVLECVSDFSYYAHAGYYACRGANIRSLNGSCAWGDYALISEGSDPNEVPLPVFLSDDMVQTATVVAYNFTSAGINTLNTSGSTTLYIRNYNHVPYNQSEIEIDHGLETDSTGNVLGLQTYSVVSAATLTNASLTGIPDLVMLNLSNANLFGSTSGGLKAPVSSGTIITVRSVDVHKFTGINPSTTYSGAPALRFLESTGTVYHILGYDSTNVVSGDSKITLREDFGYVSLQTYNTSTNAGTSTIKVLDLAPTTADRVTAQVGSTITEMTFAWHGGIYRITGYASSATLGQSYAQITISPTLGSTITNTTGAASVQLKAGLRKYAGAEITRGISILRASNHDLISLGAGGFQDSKIPSNVFGPPVNPPTVANERVERGTGRVFATTNDQDGNFKVGDYFQVNQASGDLTIKASLNLTQVAGLGFKRGVVVNEFSQDNTMIDNAGNIVPVQSAITGYISNRLGLNSAGSPSGVAKIGPGYLDLTGVQAMNGALNMNYHKIINVATGTNALDIVNKQYADSKISLAGKSAIDPATYTTNTSFGIMTGQLQLARDPISTDDGSDAATKRYVDRNARQLAAMSDVTLTGADNEHLLMFSSTVLSVSTTTSSPIWTPTNRIVNVKLDNASSDIDFTRSGNSLIANIQTGTIVDNMVNSSAAIQQSKLLMNKAQTATTATGLQADLGVATFNSAFFSSVNGFISFADSSNVNINVTSANKVNHTLQPGSYVSGSNFDGSSDQIWNINGTSTNTFNTLVARDGNGMFSGTSTNAINVRYNGISFSTATTATIANTIVARDGQGSIWGRYFIGTATQALYADLAENYQADADYEPGTVLVFGGDAEVTVSNVPQDTRIAGVVSTNPAHLMNSALAGPGVVPVAFTGRVPTKVLGPCKKGDLMVSSSIQGVATSINNISSAFAKPGSVIGKALVSIDTPTVEVIEVVVGRL